MTSRLPGWQEKFREKKRQHADFFTPLRGVFVLRDSEWPVQFSVVDVQLLKPDELARLRTLADARELIFTDLRLLTLHPDSVEPFPGSTLREYTDEHGQTHDHWQGGTLEVLEWSDPGKLTRQRTGTAVLRRP